MERRLRGRLATEAAIAWPVVIVVVCGIEAVVVFLVAPVKHTFALLEVIRNMIYSFLSRLEAMSAKSTLAWEFGLGVYGAGLVEFLRVHLGVDIAEMLDEVVLSEARSNVLDTLDCTQAADP